MAKNLTGNDPIDSGISDRKPKERVEWSTEYQVHNSDERRSFDRRDGSERRQHTGRSITVPDMRKSDRRMAGERRKVRLTITGRAMDV